MAPLIDKKVSLLNKIKGRLFLQIEHISIVLDSLSSLNVNYCMTPKLQQLTTFPNNYFFNPNKKATFLRGS